MFGSLVVCRQHELPPRKSRTVSVQAHGGSGRDEALGRFPGSPRWGTDSLSPGCAGLPLRDEPQRQRQNQEAGLRHHQKSAPEQGELTNVTGILFLVLGVTAVQPENVDPTAFLKKTRPTPPLIGFNHYIILYRTTVETTMTSTLLFISVG